MRSGFGQGTGSIWLDQVACVGTEARLADCPANPIGVHDCSHFEDAGVRCQPVTTPPPCKSMLKFSQYTFTLSTFSVWKWRNQIGWWNY